MYFKFFISLSFLFASATTFGADGPFGLGWGMSEQDTKILGVNCEEKTTQSRITVCKTTSLPKNLSISDQYALYIDGKYQLQKVTMISEIISNDIYGSEGKEIYFDLKNKLSNKYGKPSDSFEYVGDELYDESDEFYQCLAYEGCGYYLSFYKDSSGETITLEIEGIRRGSGYISLSYEGPSWGAVVDEHNNKKSDSDEDAL